MGIHPELSHSIWKNDRIIITDYPQLDESTLYNRIREIGMYDQEPSIHNGDITSPNHNTLFESSGRRITRDEVIDLTNLLRMTLDHAPKKRLSAEKVANHSWFVNSE